MTAYVPRSPRRAARLSAVVDGTQTHLRGRVRDMSTSGMFLEADGALPVGAQVAVVPLVGDFDGERFPAEVTRVAGGGMGLRFTALDADRRGTLRAFLAGERPPRRPSNARNQPSGLPLDAPLVLLTDDVVEADPVEEMSDQLVELGRRGAALEQENARLRRELAALEAKLAVRRTLEAELFELYELVDELEKANDGLVQLVTRGGR